MNKTYKHALHYHSLGFSVFPLKPKSKEPVYGSWLKYQKQKATETQVTNWWRHDKGLNIGIVCGDISQIIVIDIDDKEKLPTEIHFPPTASVTTSRGYHLYYRLKEGQKVPFKKCDWGEVRSDRSYVVAPNSIHPSGSEYVWSTGELPQLEDFEYLPENLIPNLDEKSTVLNNSKLYEFAFSESVSEGARNSTMASVIGKLLRDFPNPDDWQTIVWERVKIINETRCTPPLPIKELEKTFQSIAKVAATNPTTPKTKKEFEIVTGSELAKKQINPKPYLIDKIVYERAINAITADTGKGKSLFALGLAKSISTGEKLFGKLEVKQKKVLIIDQEMDADLIVERYKDIVGLKNTNIDYLYEQSWVITEKEDYGWLRNVILKNGYGCVIFDTLTNIHTFDENKADEMRELNKLFLKLIAETDVTLIYLHHHRKAMRGEKLSQSSSRGSTEIGAKMGSHILLDSKKSHDDQGFTITSMTIEQVKSRRPDSIEKLAFEVIYDPEKKKTEWKYLGEAENEQTGLSLTCDEIQKALKENGEMTIKDLLLEVKAGDSLLRKACRHLERMKLIQFRMGVPGYKFNTKIYSLVDDDF